MPASTTLDHVTIVTDDFEASRSVYEPILGAIGLTPAVEYEDPEADSDDTGTVAAIGYAGDDGRPVLWLVAGLVPTCGAHIALSVPDRDQVSEAHGRAAAVGVRIVQEPREWESAHLNYYGAQLADPAGNIIEVIYPH
jgi:catechol 2,3-dioxygenase-like lactoylglutathione lyase family enzyme